MENSVFKKAVTMTKSEFLYVFEKVFGVTAFKNPQIKLFNYLVPHVLQDLASIENGLEKAVNPMVVCAPC